MIQLSLGLLLLILAIVLVISYKYNEEGFTDVPVQSASSPSPVSVPSPMPTIAPSTSSATIATEENGIARSPMIRTDEKNNTVTLSQESIDSIALQLKSKILGDTQKDVKNSTLVERQTTPILKESEKKSTVTPASQQGKEYDESKPCPAYPDGSCPPYPDMSKYIKKDSIPCWNCSIDY